MGISPSPPAFPLIYIIGLLHDHTNQEYVTHGQTCTSTGYSSWEAARAGPLPEGGQAGTCGWTQCSGLPLKGSGKQTLYWQSRDDRTGQNIETGSGSIQKVLSQKAEDGTWDKATCSPGFQVTQDMRLLTAAAQAWSEMLPRIHGQGVQRWGCLGKLGHFSVLRTLAAP